MSNSSSPNPCVTRRTLVEYCNGSLAKDQIASCEQHLLICLSCQQVLSEILDSHSRPLWPAAENSSHTGTTSHNTERRSLSTPFDGRDLRSTAPTKSDDQNSEPQSRIKDFQLVSSPSMRAAGHEPESDPTKADAVPTQSPLPQTTPALKLWRKFTTSSSDTEPEFTHVGRYRIDRQLGKGGFGRVFLAVDEKLKRPVALKIPHQRFMRSSEKRDLILIEAETLANLDHPAIVPVYDVSSSQEAPLFLVSKLIEGQSLADRLQQSTFHPLDAARLIARIADALHYAHECGVIHRDIKPHNILLDKEGQAYLTDFGLAWRTAAQPQTTRRSGTPAYMSPEQVRQLEAHLDRRTDIYSLGAVLVDMMMESRRTELATTSAEDPASPFNSNDSLSPQVKRLAAQLDLKRKQWLDAGHAQGLEAICRKAIAEVPEHRYSSAAELANDLRRYAESHDSIACIPADVVGQDGPRLLAGDSSCPSHTTETLSTSQQSLVRSKRLRRVCSAVGLLVVVAALSSIAFRNQRVHPLVERVLTSTSQNFEENYLAWQAAGMPDLRQLDAECESNVDDRKVRARLATLGSHPEYMPWAVKQLLDSKIGDLPMFIVALTNHKAEIVDRMWWVVLQSDLEQLNQRFNAASYLAAACPADENWQDLKYQRAVASMLMSEGSGLLTERARMLWPVRREIVAGICTMMQSSSREILTIKGEERGRAFDVWELLAADDPDLMAELIVESSPFAFKSLLSRIKTMSMRDELIEPLRQRVQQDRSDLQQKANSPFIRQHLAGLALVTLDHPQDYWKFFRHTFNPASSQYGVTVAKSYGVTTKLLINRLKELNGLKPEKPWKGTQVERLFDVRLSERRLLFLALAQFSRSDATEEDREELVQCLGELCRSETDPGTRAVAELLLKAWGEEEILQGIKLEYGESCNKLAADRPDWYINPVGQCMIRVQKTESIPYSFVIGSHEVSRRQFKEFLKQAGKESGIRWDNTAGAAGVSDECPQCGLSWFDCAAFCNWLSRKENLETCYEANADGLYAEGMSYKKHWRKCNGYRLPTMEEWEYSARAGVTTQATYGNGTYMLDRFAHWANTSKQQAQPVGMLRPNALGLFDIHGNAREWLLTERLTQANVDSIKDDLAETAGGSFLSRDPCELNFGYVIPYPANSRVVDAGFRIARCLTEESPDLP